MAVTRIHDLIELQDTIDTHENVAVSFGAPSWCVPCRRLAPHFAAASEQTDAVFVEIDVDECPDAPDFFGFQTVPTVLLFVKGASKEIRGRTAISISKEIKKCLT